jgi:hypothetical protein
MNRDDRASSNDPTSELTADPSTQSASGRSTGRSGRRVEDEDPVNRADLETPRRYEQALPDDADPVMPADDSTMNTKI